MTGANGFVGSALCAALRARGHSVTGVVRRDTGEEHQLSIGDITATTSWDSVLAGCDVVVHLAARVHVMNDQETNPIDAFRAVNLHATLNLAAQAVQRGVKRFIFMSSIGVSGAETFGEGFSEVSESRPHSPYAVSKFEAEKGVRKICTESAMEFVIIRPPLVYGARAPGNFESLLKIVRAGLPLPLKGIDNRRSMICLENLVDFIAVCAEHPMAANQLFLTADGIDLSTPGLITALSDGMKKNSRLFPVPTALIKFGAQILGKQAMYQQLCCSLQVDISKARALLNWVPPVSVYEGLGRAAQGFSNEKNF